MNAHFMQNPIPLPADRIRQIKFLLKLLSMVEQEEGECNLQFNAK